MVRSKLSLVGVGVAVALGVTGVAVIAPEQSVSARGSAPTRLAAFALGAVPASDTSRRQADNSVRSSFATTTAARFAAGQVLVAPSAGVSPQDLQAVNDRLGAQVVEVLPGTRVRAIDLPRGLSVEEAVKRYERSPLVRFAEPDYLVRTSQTSPVTPNDPSYRQLFGLNNSGQTGGTADADIDAPEAWGVTTGDADTLVAVIDTGVDISHPDLDDNVWTNPGEIAGNGRDDDGNGYVDDVHGWDFFNNDNTVYDGAEDSHGTHVAGTIAATGGNGIGVTGVSWRAQVMPLKFIAPGGGYTSDAIAALEYAVANGARLSNNSWGGGGPSQALKEAIDAAGNVGHLFVAAAGNGGSDGIGDDTDLAPSYPASFDSGNIISVEASDSRDGLASFSNYGPLSVDLAAPGVGILSTLPNNSYGSYSGTSMATPHVTGAAALLLSANPGFGALQIKARLLDTVDRVAAFSGTSVTAGRLNAGRALSPTTMSVLTLTANPPTLTVGASTALSGRLTAEGQPLGGQSVLLQQRPVGTTAWSAVASTLTSSEGTFALPGLRPTTNTDYRASFAGDAVDAAPAVSEIRRANVSVRVSLALPTRDLQLGRSRTASGAVIPAHTGTVRMVISRNGDVITRKTLALSDSRYQSTYKPTRPGDYSIFTVRFADDDHLGARSPAKGFRVVR
jgi:subtilisin family serine protease